MPPMSFLAEPSGMPRGKLLQMKEDWHEEAPRPCTDRRPTRGV
jgi:hypothetical protein